MLRLQIHCKFAINNIRHSSKLGKSSSNITLEEDVCLPPLLIRMNPAE